MLFIDATIECYSVWQHIMLGYVVTSIIPFGLYISAAPYFLTSGHMTLISFYFGCHFPLPSLFYITYLRMRNFKPINHKHWSNEASAVSILLQGPFCSISVLSVDICWAGMLLFRRIILILHAIYKQNVLSKLLSMSTVCLRLTYCSCVVMALQRIQV